MKKPLFVLFCCLSATLGRFGIVRTAFVRRSLDRACVQAAQLDSELTDTTLYPTSLDRAGALELKSIRSWVSGFFPGTCGSFTAKRRTPRGCGAPSPHGGPLRGFRLTNVPTTWASWSAVQVVSVEAYRRQGL